MKKEQFEEKLPIVLEALKAGIDNELGNYYDYNFNSYEDLVNNEPDWQTFELFQSYAKSISEVEDDSNNLGYHSNYGKKRNADVIIDAIDDYSKGGYKFTEEDDGIEFDETPFINKEELKEFCEYLKNI